MQHYTFWMYHSDCTLAAYMVITRHAMYGSSSRIWLVPVLNFRQLTYDENGSILTKFISMFHVSNKFLPVMYFEYNACYVHCLVIPTYLFSRFR